MKDLDHRNLHNPKNSGYWYGKKLPNYIREKMSFAKIGKKLYLEQRRKMSISRTGKKFSVDTKEKMRISWKKRRKKGVSNETREKIKDNWYKYHTPNTFRGGKNVKCKTVNLDE